MAIAAERIRDHLGLLFITLLNLTHAVAFETILVPQGLMHLSHLRVLAVAFVTGLRRQRCCSKKQRDGHQNSQQYLHALIVRILLTGGYDLGHTSRHEERRLTISSFAAGNSYEQR